MSKYKRREEDRRKLPEREVKARPVINDQSTEPVTETANAPEEENVDWLKDLPWWKRLYYWFLNVN